MSLNLCPVKSGSNDNNKDGVNKDDNCGCLVYQSPIALSSESTCCNLQSSYKRCNKIFKSKSLFVEPLEPIKDYKYDIKQVQWQVNNKVVILNNQEVYTMVEFHFHQPGEHVINQKKYPMELHLVFLDKKDNIYVVGFPIKKVSKKFFKKLLLKESDNVGNKTLSEESKSTITDPVITRIINGQPFEVPKLVKYFSYPGSLTTPPFTKTVTWNVSKQPLNISKQDLKLLKPMSKGARPIQPRSGRDIVYAKCKPRC